VRRERSEEQTNAATQTYLAGVRRRRGHGGAGRMFVIAIIIIYLGELWRRRHLGGLWQRRQHDKPMRN
jgi:hypothetical protein